LRILASKDLDSRQLLCVVLAGDLPPSDHFRGRNSRRGYDEDAEGDRALGKEMPEFALVPALLATIDGLPRPYMHKTARSAMSGGTRGLLPFFARQW
jgi:hypothetical protein